MPVACCILIHIPPGRHFGEDHRLDIIRKIDVAFDELHGRKGHRSGMPLKASSRIWAAICIGLTLRSGGAALLGEPGQPLAGGLAHRHLGMPHPARIGGPAGAKALAGLEAGLDGFDDLGQPGGTERTAAGVRAPGRPPSPRDRRQSSRCSWPCGQLPPFLAFGRRGGGDSSSGKPISR